MCDCIDRIGTDLLKNHNTELRHTVPLTNTAVARVIIATEKWDTKSKQKPLTLVGSFCPFCGEKYQQEGTKP